MAAAALRTLVPVSEAKSSFKPRVSHGTESSIHLRGSLNASSFSSAKLGLLRNHQAGSENRLRSSGKVKSCCMKNPHKASHEDSSAGCVSSSTTTRCFDFIVIGSGVAGLRYALDVAKYGSVAVITKSEPQESNTNYAQGGVSAVLDPLDSVENHMRDTIVAGAFLCDEETVEVVCREGPDRVRELIAFGASFDQSEDGQLLLAREGGHSHNRIVHTADMTGREIERALLKAVKSNSQISIFEHHFALDLLTREDGGRITCHGLDTLNVRTKEIIRFISAVTLLATGGAGHIYPNTTNPLVATGDGVAMGHRAHAVISNMEFVQFHPTALADEGLPIKPKARENAFLITEAVRGAGGQLFNMSMERFMPEYDSRAELAPRDVVARSIDDQLKKRNEKYVYLNISHIPAKEILGHFPNIARECLNFGLDITQAPIPVVPAAHYMCGGIQTGLLGQTSISGLYAAGEVTCTGLHGANRLASNSLLEALVFAQRAVSPSRAHFEKVQEFYRRVDERDEWIRPVHAAEVLEETQLEDIRNFTGSLRGLLQQLMWEYVGIVRSTQRLEIAQRKLEQLEIEWEEFLFRRGWKWNLVDVAVCEMRNLICVAHVVVESALSRRESRGLHYTVDYPELADSRRLPTVIVPSFWRSGMVSRLSTGSVSRTPIEAS